MKIKEKDFVEIDFTAKTEDGKVFDTTNKEEAKKANLPETEYKSVKICIGEGFLLKGLDKELIDKEIGKEYEIKLEPEEAFGKRISELVKIIPLKVFHEKEINPYPGLPIAIDNSVATIRAVSGGRVITDFNHPLAGKRIIYKIIVKKKIEKDSEKVDILLSNYLRLDKDKYEIEDKQVFLKIKLPDLLIKEIEKKIKELVGDYSLEFREKKEGKEKIEGEKKEDKKKEEDKKKAEEKVKK